MSCLVWNIESLGEDNPEERLKEPLNSFAKGMEMGPSEYNEYLFLEKWEWIRDPKGCWTLRNH